MNFIFCDCFLFVVCERECVFVRTDVLQMCPDNQTTLSG